MSLCFDTRRHQEIVNFAFYFPFFRLADLPWHPLLKYKLLLQQEIFIPCIIGWDENTLWKIIYFVLHAWLRFPFLQVNMIKNICKWIWPSAGLKLCWGWNCPNTFIYQCFCNTLYNICTFRHGSFDYALSCKHHKPWTDSRCFIYKNLIKICILYESNYGTFPHLVFFKL